MVEDKPLVTVVIPVYKVEKYLSGSIDSALLQNYTNIQIILVNDGSPDKCPDICDEYANKYTNIQVIHKKNGGLSEARNFGIKQAAGKYILFLDSDDQLVVNAIKELVEVAERNNADVVIPDRYYKVDEENDTKELTFHFKTDKETDNPIDFALNTIIGQGRAWRATAILYKVDLIHKNNLSFPVGYIAEDIVFNLSYLKISSNISFLKSPTLLNLKRAESITTTFQENLGDVFLFIDKKVKEFLVETGKNNRIGFIKLNELLCRNTIIYITSIFSSKCYWNKTTRIDNATQFLNNNRVREAFTVNRIAPYFESKTKIFFMKIMFVLIKFKFWKTAFKFSEIVQK